MRKLLIAGVMASVAVFVSACSEPDQSARYAEGQYSGKTDAQPWTSAAFNGDKAKWDHATSQRTRNQNEYLRSN